MASFTQGSKASIQNLVSKAELNGQEVVIGALLSTGRYEVMLSNGTKMALKPANLLPTSSTTGGFPSTLFNNPMVQQYMAQFQNILTPIQQLVPGVDPKMVVGGLLGVLVLSSFLFGMMRSALLFSIIAVVVQFGLAPFKRAGGGRAGAQAAAAALGATTSNKIKQVSGFSISANQSLLAVGVLLFIAFKMSGPSATPVYGGGSSSSSHNDINDSEDLDDEDAAFFAQAPKLYSWDDVSQAYSKGFADVSNQKTLEEGLADFSKLHKKKEPRSGTTGSRYSAAPAPPPLRSQATSSSSGGWGMMQYFTLAMLGSTIYGLGKTPAGGFGKWEKKIFRSLMSPQFCLSHVLFFLFFIRCD